MLDQPHLQSRFPVTSPGEIERTMADGSSAKFNNAAQRAYGGVITPVVYVWETNDPVKPWYAEARLLDGKKVVAKFAQASAMRRQTAKDIAARTGYLWLIAQHPNIDLVNV
ncbi:hypothetical protein H1R20_g11220, partial [Candolleomyces eurysporus]